MTFVIVIAVAIAISYFLNEYYRKAEADYENTITYKNLAQEEWEKEDNERELRLEQIRPLLRKYFSQCDDQNRIAIHHLSTKPALSTCFYQAENLDEIREHLLDSHDNLEQTLKTGKYEDLDSCLTLKAFYETSLKFLDDLEKMFKLITIKKGINCTYDELMNVFNEFTSELLEQEREIIFNAAYTKISVKLKDELRVRSILKEFIRFLPYEFEELAQDVISLISLLEKFDSELRLLIESTKQETDEAKRNLLIQELHLEQLIIDRTWIFGKDHESAFIQESIEKLVEELKEEIDLEDFENNLGKPIKPELLPDHNLLNGHEFEGFLNKLFKALNYTVTQTKGSGDQGADLILVKDGAKTAVQAKKYTGNVSNKAIQEVVAAKAHYNCQSAMVVTTGEFTKSAIELAISNNVELWDNSKLKRMIDEANSSYAA